MEDRDFVTRYVSFYLQDYNAYQPDLDSFMNKGMSKIKSLSDFERVEMKSRFIKSMQTAIKLFGDDAFRKRTNIYDRRKPINKALFEVQSVIYAKMEEPQLRLLISKKQVYNQKFIELNNDEKFRYAISSGTGQRESVIRRFSEMKRIVEETIEERIMI